MALAFMLSIAAPLVAHSQADTRGVYIGVSGGQTQVLNYSAIVCDPLLTSTCKTTGSAYRFFGGWQFGRNWAVEFAYTDLGKVSASTPGTYDQSIKVRVGEMTLVGLWPVSERIGLYGKAGAYYGNSSTDITQNGVEQRVTQSRGNPTFGFGLQGFVTQRLALRGEAQRYMKVSTAIGDFNYNAYTLGLLFKF